MKTFSIINIKGGVGKTATNLCMSSILSEKLKRKVLSIDMDSQNSLSSHHLIDYSGYTIKDVLLGRVTIDQALNCLTDKHEFIPSDIELMTINHNLNMPARETLLTQKLLPYDGDYDYCLIDTPPNLMLETSMAIHAADVILIPTQLNRWSMTAIDLTIDWVHQIEKAYKLPEKLITILPTFYHRNSVSMTVLRNLREKYREQVPDTIIRKRLDMDKVSLMKLDISAYTSSDVYSDYYKFIKEVHL